MDKLNNLFITYMCGKDPYAEVADEAVAMPQKPASGGDEAKDGERPPSGGGSSKKKKSKR